MRTVSFLFRPEHAALLVLGLLLSCCESLSLPSADRIDSVSRLIADTLVSTHGDTSERYASVREMASRHDRDYQQATTSTAIATTRASTATTATASLSSKRSIPSNELVYGELSVPVLAELLEAVGMEDGDAFLDIGSGDGALVLGAAMLYPDKLRVARGIELLPGLVSRSQEHAKELLFFQNDEGQQGREILENGNANNNLSLSNVPVEFSLGDVHEAGSDNTVSSILSDSTIAVCFATTWSANNSTPENLTSLKGRSLPKLSKALVHMPIGSRILIIDGRLDPADGYRWEGDMKITCPDTAPFSVAALYERR